MEQKRGISPRPSASGRAGAARVTILYALLGGLWLFASDPILEALATEPAQLSSLQTGKGWLLVLASALLLYLLLRNAGTGPGQLPGRPDSPAAAPPASPKIPILDFTLLTLAIAAASVLLFTHQKRSQLEEKKNELAAIVRLKVAQVSSWRAGLIQNAELITLDHTCLEEMKSWIAGGSGPGEARDELAGHLEAMRRIYGYQAVSLWSPEGELQLAAGHLDPEGSPSGALIRKALTSGKITLSGLHRGSGDEDSHVHLELAIPLASRDASPPRWFGALAITVEAHRFLYPLVEQWPTPSPSAETILLRPEGEKVVRLSRLRHTEEVAPPMRGATCGPNPMINMVRRGEEGTVENIDYRGRPVLAQVARVPGSPWFLIAKVDTDEIFASLHRNALAGSLLAAILIAFAGATVYFWWRQQRNAFLARQYRSEVQRQALAQRFDCLTRFANDIILLMDKKGRILEANDRATAAFGVDRRQLLGARVQDFRSAEARTDFASECEALEDRKSLIFETAYRRSDGTAFPAEVSARLIEVDGKSLFQGIIRDITDRKQAERRIANLNRLYATLSQANEAIVRISEEETLFDEICRIVAQVGQFRMAWIGLVDHPTGYVRPAASAGAGVGYLDGIRISVNGDAPEGRGPVGKAIRDGSPQVCADLQSDPETRLWREAAARYGFRSSAAFPLRRGGKIIGTLCVYAKEAHFFDKALTDLLVKLTMNISFALNNFDRDTLRRKAEDALRLSATVFENGIEGIIITNAQKEIISVNRAFTETTGFSAEEVLGRNPSILSSGRHTRDFFRTLWSSLHRTGRWQGEIWNRRKNGEVYPQWLGISAVTDEQGETSNYIGTFSDISERKAADEHIDFLAHYDPLTGLPNRSLLQDRLRQALAGALRQQRKVAVLSLGLDRFKAINDSLGHSAGDRLLRELARRIKDLTRDSDTVSRLGNDEFCLVLGGLQDVRQAAHMAQKILGTVSAPCLVDGQTLRVTASIGISIYPDDADDIAGLQKSADTALHHAKGAGRNNFQFFTREMGIRVFEALTLENALRRGIERGELLLHYQPKVCLQSGKIVGAEALVRWLHPDMGMVPPDKFIPIAEERGLIDEIGTWVLRQACGQARQWREWGLPQIPVAVNISALQLRGRQLPETIGGILEETGLPASALELELTESALMEDADQTIDILENLKAMGLNLAIDDFGTGYSSLNYLKRFPIDRLKIDRSFIRDLATKAEDAAIARAIIAMGKALKLNVIAEGVETEEQLAFLKTEGCREYQGYYFSRPLPAAEFASLFEAALPQSEAG